MNGLNNINPVRIAKVAVELAAYYFDKLYDYIIPIEINDEVFIGQRVLVPFGKGNKKRLGIILELCDFSNDDKFPYFTQNGLSIKPISRIIDNKKLINDDLIKIIPWIKKNTFCRYFDAVNLILPSGFSLSLSMKYKISPSLNDDVYNSLSKNEKLLLLSLESDINKKNSELPNLFIEALSKDQQIIVKSLINKGIILEREIIKRKIQDSKALMVKLSDKYPDFVDDQKRNYKITQKQKKVIELLIKTESASLKEIVYFCGVTKTVIDNLYKKGLVTFFEVETYRKPYNFLSQILDFDIKLNFEQQKIFKELVSLICGNQPDFALIRGVTGSGKTLIFMSLIKYVVDNDKSVILLLPEISLIPQMISNLQKYFGNLLAILHSGLSLANRLDEWKRIKNGNAKIVIGTRSAIFAPCENLGLIIMDEEQEEAYKSDKTPRYHARDIAKLRAINNNCLFLMTSATPSVETYYLMKKNKFHIFELDKRYNDAVLPKISIVDMQKEKQEGNQSFFSRKLILAIENNLKQNQQSIIFINRRGYNTIIKCDECGYVEKCLNCDIALTYHKSNNRLMCHYCGFSKQPIKRCPKCDSIYLKYFGTGTQKIETQLQDIFPQARLLRMDADTTLTKYSHDEIFKKFLAKEYDILIGTQMVTKGFNFPGVTLVGVIDADSSLYISDYKCVEHTYDIITQVVGRSGREKLEGQALIQTFSMENEIFKFIVDQDYKKFFDSELIMRKNLLYPPFCNMSIIGLVGSNLNLLVKVGKQVFNFIKDLVNFNKDPNFFFSMFGPMSAPVSFINNKYHIRLVLKYFDNKKFRYIMDKMLLKFSKEVFKYNINIFVDKM